MRILLVYPIFPKTFWSYEKILELVDRKVLLPPLGLVTVAAILPQEWEFRLIDRNVRCETDTDWDWAELVIISGMIVQKPDMLHLISQAKQRGKLVAVGGPYVTSVPEPAREAAMRLAHPCCLRHLGEGPGRAGGADIAGRTVIAQEDACAAPAGAYWLCSAACGRTIGRTL